MRACRVSEESNRRSRACERSSCTSCCPLDGVAEDPRLLSTDWDDATDGDLAAVIATQEAVILGVLQLRRLGGLLAEQPGRAVRDLHQQGGREACRDLVDRLLDRQLGQRVGDRRRPGQDRPRTSSSRRGGEIGVHPQHLGRPGAARRRPSVDDLRVGEIAPRIAGPRATTPRRPAVDPARSDPQAPPHRRALCSSTIALFGTPDEATLNWASVRECHLTLGSRVAAASAGVALVIARTDGAAIPTAQDTTTSTAAVTSTASVPNASGRGGRERLAERAPARAPRARRTSRPETAGARDLSLKDRVELVVAECDAGLEDARRRARSTRSATAATARAPATPTTTSPRTPPRVGGSAAGATRRRRPGFRRSPRRRG